jgi:hypothetical protein
MAEEVIAPPRYERLPSYTQTRRLQLDIEVQNIGDDRLLPYVERALKIWLARGAPEDGLTEIVPASDWNRTPEITIVMTTKHESIVHPAA